jgi:quinol monooxygenase YgiN
MIALYAEFTAQPGCTQEVADLLQGLAVAVRAEPGNAVFDIYQLESDPRRFFVYEIYEDQAAIDTHLQAEYGTLFNKRLNALIEEQGSQLTFLRPVASPALTDRT